MIITAEWVFFHYGMDFSQVVREVKDLFENVLSKAAMDI
jgi:hypothetical protein